MYLFASQDIPFRKDFFEIIISKFEVEGREGHASSLLIRFSNTTATPSLAFV